MPRDATPLDALGVTLPVLAAPLAGGATTPALVLAAAQAGGLGFLAAGYRTAADLAGDLDAVEAANVPFGVNVFAPAPVPVGHAAFAAYAARIAPEAAAVGVALDPGAEPREDDDDWAAKADLLLARPVPLVSFTFGIPAATTVTALHRAGTIVVQTVTSVAEACAAREAGVDLLVLQGPEAGGHSGTLAPARVPPRVALGELVAAVRAEVRLPVIAAGGLATPDAVARVVAAGAAAALVGTALLRTGESGASAVHRAALADPEGRGTVVTHAFTGRPARALRNGFLDRHDGHAPLGYPALHHLTSPLRRAAAAAGDASRVHLWAGTGHREARAEPAAATLTRLASAL